MYYKVNVIKNILFKGFMQIVLVLLDLESSIKGGMGLFKKYFEYCSLFRCMLFIFVIQNVLFKNDVL